MKQRFKYETTRRKGHLSASVRAGEKKISPILIQK